MFSPCVKILRTSINYSNSMSRTASQRFRDHEQLKDRHFFHTVEDGHVAVKKVSHMIHDRGVSDSKVHLMV